MAWKCPMSLELIAAHRIIENVLDHAENSLNFALSEKYVDWKSMRVSSSIYSKSLQRIRDWWLTIPGIKGSSGKSLQIALTRLSDNESSSSARKLKYVCNFLLKTVLLDNLSTNKDYDNNANICLIPSPLETFVANIIIEMKPLNCVCLNIYQGLYPIITESLLVAATKLRKLEIFHVNLSNEFVRKLGECCPLLEVIHFHHIFIWNCISIDSLYYCFFQVESRAYLNTCQEQSISFPNLYELSIAFTVTKQMINFHKDVLRYYPKLERVWHDWKPNMFEDEYLYYTSSVIIPITSTGTMISLKTLLLNYDDLCSLSSQQLSSTITMMPRLQEILIDYSSPKCNIATSRMHGRKLRLFNSMNIFTIRLNVPGSYTSTMNLMSPLLNDIGSNLSKFILETNNSTNIMSLSVIKSFLSKCPNLRSLKIIVSHRSLITISDCVAESFPKLSSLQELWIHEEAPWSLPDSTHQELSSQTWFKMVNKLTCNFPSITTLSLTICKNTSDVLQISTNARYLHLFFKDGCEWDVPITKIYQLVSKCPQLERLYLEELEGEDFWKVHKYYENSQLKIHWGNLFGWPRT